MDKHLGRTRGRSTKQTNLLRAQTYALWELGSIHEALFGPEEKRERVQRLEEAFRYDANSVVRRELNPLYCASLTGDDFTLALAEICSKYRLEEERREYEERCQPSRGVGTPCMVCCTAVI